jgi:hypothetical protein
LLVTQRGMEVYPESKYFHPSNGATIMRHGCFSWKNRNSCIIYDDVKCGMGGWGRLVEKGFDFNL